MSSRSPSRTAELHRRQPPIHPRSGRQATTSGTDGGGVTSPNSGERARALVGAAAVSVVLSYLLAVATAAVAGLTIGAAPAPWALLVAAVPLWLAAHQIPLVITGAALGALPLLPTAAVIALVAVCARRAAERLGGRWREDGPPVVASLAGVHASLAVLTTALPESPARAAAWSALLGGGLVAAIGATVGVFRCAGPPAWWGTAPGWLRTAVAATRTAVAALAGAASLMLLVRLLAVANEVHARLENASPTLGARVGITLLSLGYLPNVLVASVSWLAGPGLSIGAVAASPLYTSPGAVPPIPLMAVMPTSRPPAWVLVVFVLPLVVGVLTGLRCRGADADPARRLAAVGFAACSVGMIFGAAASVVSGHLAGGPFDPVDVPVLAVAASLVGWVGLPAAIVVVLPSPGSWRRRPGGRTGAVDDGGPVAPAGDHRFVDHPTTEPLENDYLASEFGEDEFGEDEFGEHESVEHDAAGAVSVGDARPGGQMDRTDHDHQAEDFPEFELDENGELEPLDPEDR
jgi:hypothetical protein